MKSVNKIIYVLFIILIFIYLDFNKLWSFLPQSTHQWRQTDSASFMYIFYQNGLNLFQPGIMNSMNGDYHTLAELPIFYYFGAIFCKLFFYSEGWLRLIHFLIFSIGFYYFYLFVLSASKSVIFSIAIVCLSISSPVLLYYSFNLLPDPAGFGFSLITISLILLNEFQRITNSQKWLLVVSLSIAGMIKLPFIFLPAFYVFAQVFSKKSINNILFPVLISFILSIIWVVFTNFYNHIHHSDYFLARWMPIWDCDSETIKNIFNRIKTGWFFDYFSLEFWLLFLCSFIYLIFKAINNYNSSFNIWISSFIISSIIFLFWFIQFEHHDYYLIFIYPFFILTTFLGLNTIIKNNEQAKYYVILIIFTASFFQFSNAKKVIWDRYDLNSPFQKDCISSVYHNVPEIQDWLKENNVGYDDKILNISDGMTNGTLYFLRRHGWNQFNFRAHHQELNKAGVDYFHNIGAKYLVFDEKRWLDTIWVQEKMKNNQSTNFKDSLYIVKMD